MTYVMSDIHGNYKAFIQMLNKIELSDNDTLYILGDVIDRGLESFKILDYVMQHDNIILLFGNHEDMMIEFYDAVDGISGRKDIEYLWAIWSRNGGTITSRQFERMQEEEKNKYRNFIKNLEYFKIIEVNNQKFLLCHAGIMFSTLFSLEECIQKNINNKNIVWLRDVSGRDMPDGLILIHGHTPVQSAFDENKIINYGRNGKKNIYNIDCGCAYNYILSCMRLDDMKEFYVKC